MIAIAAFAVWTAFAEGRTVIADFEERVAAYMQIHKAAEAEMGPLTAKESSKQIDAKMVSLGEGVRAKRANAAQGDVFTPAIAAEFRNLIATGIKHRPKRIRQSIRSGEPVMASLHVNGAYPEGMPLQTMPPTLLESFPRLPAELEYRFVGTTLILRDASANVIVDLIPNAIVMH
jgi:hypothetical protein